MELIGQSFGRINPKYDLHADNIADINDASENFYDLICNGFRFGYMQGRKAAIAEIKKTAVR